MIRTALLFLLALTSFAHAQRYAQDLIGRWKVEFQDPPEQQIVLAQLRSLNLEYLASRMDLPALDPLIITISRNKFLIQADSQLLEVYNCVIDPDEIVILDRQEKLSPIPLAYEYELVDDHELILTGTLNKINNLPVTLKLRRVMAIPTFGDGQRGFLTRQGFLDVGVLQAFRNEQVVIKPKNKKPMLYQVGQLDPLDQISLHEPELVAPDRIEASFEEEKRRFRGLPYPILTSSEPAQNPVFFTKEYFFDENSMSEGYLITVYNTEHGEVQFRATGSGGGAARGDLDFRYIKDRSNQDRMIIWMDDEEIFERPLDEVEAELAAQRAEDQSSDAPQTNQPESNPAQSDQPQPNPAQTEPAQDAQSAMNDAPANIEMIEEPIME